MLSKLESESCNDSMIGFSILALSLTNTQFFALFSERRLVRNDDSGEDDDDDVIMMLSSSGEGIMVTIQCVFGMLGLGNFGIRRAVRLDCGNLVQSTIRLLRSG